MMGRSATLFAASRNWRDPRGLALKFCTSG
jgi:hypothetical protein